MRVESLTDYFGAVVCAENGDTINQVDIEEVKNLFRSSGAVYFKGFNIDIDGFEAFGNRLSSDFMDNTGSGSFRKTANSGNDGTIQNVAYVYGVAKQRTFPLPLHADRSYVKSQPEAMFFMCARPAKTGGETTVCDGIKLLDSLSDKTRKLFESKRIKYIRYYTKEEWPVLFHTQDMSEVKEYCRENDLALFINDDGSLRTEYVRHAIMSNKYTDKPGFVNSMLIQLWQEEGLGRMNALVRLEDNSKIPADVLHEVREVSESLTVNLPWHSGDFVMVDNTRLMHGRREFDDPDREVYVRMCRSVDW
jgi:alpha-ketoglutarate-dependent taurine dioxygenase